MMTARQRRLNPLPAPAPGIYELGGTVNGERCWIAYDADGKGEIRSGDDAYWELEQWLAGRGVKLLSSPPALFLL